MSQYRFLVPHSIGPYYFPAGSIASTADATPPGLLPVGFIPNGGCDPLDASAVAAMYAAGPSRVSLAFTGTFVAPPATYWVFSFPQPSNSGVQMWRLTGLGAALAPLNTQNGCGVVP
jgi:hypothetical protein